MLREDPLLHLLGEIPDWHRDAACAGLGDLMFPEDYPKGHLHVYTVEKAKALCGRCPVKTPCLDEALSWPPSEDAAGVRGGLTRQERRKVRYRG